MSSKNIIQDFPILAQKDKFVYLDSAATSQKPKQVIEAEKIWYERFNANIHRGAYDLAEQATTLYEGVRGKVMQFINATTPKSIVFTSGTTSGINTVASSWAKHNLSSGDVIVLTEMEHHANIVPWQILAKEKNLQIKFWPIADNGELEDIDFAEFFQDTKMLCITHVSNVLGNINPLEKIIPQVQNLGVKVLVDAAQSIGHMPIDVQKLKPDWLVFSSHKMLGPTGVGVLYVSPDRFTEMHPAETGGDMIREVTKEKSTFKPMPWLLEAGTRGLAQVFALGEAIDYLLGIGMKKIQHHDELLVGYLYDELKKIDSVNIFGLDKNQRSGLVSFTIDNIHPHDLATLLNDYGICIRAGHHCAQPLHDKLNIPATARASVYIYNTKEDVDYFIKSLQEIINNWKNASAI